MLLNERGVARLWERVKGYVELYVRTYDKLAVATTHEKGQVRPDGKTITVDEDGTIHGVEQVPIATTLVAGKVKPDGRTIAVEVDGTISTIFRSKVYLDIRTDDDGYDKVAVVIEDDVEPFYPIVPEPIEPDPGSGDTPPAFNGIIDGPATSVDDNEWLNRADVLLVSLPNCVTVGSSAFQGCTSLSSVTLPVTTTIGSSAFTGCTSLTTVSLPSCESIDDTMFKGCTSLSAIYLTGLTSAPRGLPSNYFDCEPCSIYVSQDMYDHLYNYWVIQIDSPGMAYPWRDWIVSM